MKLARSFSLKDQKLKVTIKEKEVGVEVKSKKAKMRLIVNSPNQEVLENIFTGLDEDKVSLILAFLTKEGL